VEVTVMGTPDLRRRVVDLLHKFSEPDIRGAWLRCQAMMWDREPAEVFSLLAHVERMPPAGRFTLSDTPEPAVEPWWVLDTNLLTSRPVWLAPREYRPTGYDSRVAMAEVLCGLLDELGEPLPSMDFDGDGPDEWAEHATQTLVATATTALTPSMPAAVIATAIVWRVFGVNIDPRTIPVGPIVHDPVDGWHDTLDTLTTAQSAAATVLATLGVEVGADGAA